jgi:hypothetical protein
MDLESWVIDLLENIKEAAENDMNFDLHLEASYVVEIAEAYDKSKWIEIY